MKTICLRALAIATAGMLTLITLPINVQAAKTAPLVAPITITTAYTTGYTWWDNSPQGDSICCAFTHTHAGGTGTYADPITLAVGLTTQTQLDYAPGTIFYMPDVHRYFVVEDSCGSVGNGCHVPPSNGATLWVDRWVGGPADGAQAGVVNCANFLTDDGGVLHTLIENPPSNLPVYPGSLYQNGSCTPVFGNGTGPPPPPTAPGPPTSVGAVAGEGQVSLTWTAPANAGGPAITGYTVMPYIGSTPQTAIPTGSTATSLTVTGLAHGTGYSFTVTATNSIGTGPESSHSSTAFPFTGPAAESLGGVLTTGPAVSTWAANRTDVFFRGSDNALYHRSWNGTSWTAAENLGGGLGSAPAAVSWGPDRIDVFVRGSDGQLWHKGWYGTSWGSWAPLGGGLAGAPTVASWTSGRLDVFVQGTDGQLWHKGWYGTTWGPWQPLGGGLAGAPAAVSWSSNRIDVFIRATDNALWQRSWTGTGWTAWMSHGGVVTSAPAVASCTPQHLDVYALGANSVLWQIGFNGTTWSAWNLIGSQWMPDPAAVCRFGTATVDLFFLGNESNLWHTTATAS